MLKSHYEVLGSNLKLFDVDEQDAGVYICHANSTADPIGKTAETELLVIGKHRNPQKTGLSINTRSPMACGGIKILFLRVVCFLSLSLGEGIENTQ